MKTYLKITRFDVIVHKPDSMIRAPKIGCAYCSLQGVSWCLKCFAPLCAKHIWPQLAAVPYTRIFMYDGDEAFCREHAPPRPIEPEGWV